MHADYVAIASLTLVLSGPAAPARAAVQSETLPAAIRLVSAGWEGESQTGQAGARQRTDNGRRGRGQARFDHLDGDRDGRLSRAEFPLGGDWFDRLDDNRDGFLSRQEFRDRRSDNTNPSNNDDDFAALDRNGDRRITPDEWKLDRVWFTRLDDNEDGALTRDELFDTDEAPATASRFDTWDRNRDGRLVRSEWGGEAGAFDALDDNRDGAVSRTEFASRADEAPGGDPARFDDWDHDNDGRLVVSEWHADGPSFTHLDVNRDGAIARSEYFGYGIDPRAHEFSVWDVNNDGRVARTEWRGDEAAFRRLDRNRDGGLVRGEFLDRSGEPRGEQFDDWDHDNNGVLSRTEWHGKQAEFAALDRDRGGSLERYEFARGQATTGTIDPLPARFDDWDWNRDGRLVRSEWRAGEAAFAVADANRDGSISRVEFGRQAEPAGVDSWFATADRNRDGRISSNEWTGARATFTWLDRNGNGALDRDEVLQWREHMEAWADGDAAYRAGFDRGVTDGLLAGRGDRGKRYDLDGQRELERADAGYYASLGSRESYQAGYRAGFHGAYRDGYDGR